MNLIKLRCTNKEREVYHDENMLCSFGRIDLSIKNDCNINYRKCSTLGYEYELPSENKEFALAGS